MSQDNRLSGAPGVSSGFNHLSIAYIQNNTFNLTATLAALIAGGHVTDLDASNNQWVLTLVWKGAIHVTDSPASNNQWLLNSSG